MTGALESLLKPVGVFQYDLVRSPGSLDFTRDIPPVLRTLPDTGAASADGCLTSLSHPRLAPKMAPLSSAPP